MSQWQDTVSRIRRWLGEKPLRADLAAVLTLTLLWALFFWRVLTPNPANQVSYPTGDFSGQFLAFASYQARRLLSGEVPLWNPYNMAGHPFLADTQAAVFYPPRLLTIAITQFTGGFNYAALQAEALAHYWLGAVLMYLFVRTVTRSPLAGLVSAITVTYGGYLTGYPPLQLAVLEAGIWLPLALLGVFKASQEDGHWHAGWLSLSALALGLSLAAGHPQTTLFLIYVLLAYMIHRAIRAHIRWLPALLGVVGVVALGFGVAAVQMLPGLEYMRLTVRSELGIDALSGGFPFRDLAVLVLPNVLTLWSPLYSGIAALALAGVAVWQKEDGARFWLVVVLVALVLSFGGATVFYRLVYLLAPGASWFRGQERAAYIIAHGVAILAGLGTAALQARDVRQKPLARVLGIAAGVAALAALEALIISRFVDEPEPLALLNGLFLLAGLALAVWFVIGRLSSKAKSAWWGVALLVLVVFDVFSTSLNTNWEPIPASERLQTDDTLTGVIEGDDSLYRVDIKLGLPYGNYGTLVGWQDIRGVSPLELSAHEQYERLLPEYRLHELLSVKYVFTDWQQLERPSTVVASNETAAPPVYVHRLDDPLPRAWMAYTVSLAENDAQALGWLSDPAFNPRTTVILNRPPQLDLPTEPPVDAQVEVTAYEPEHIALTVDTPADGMLVISEMDYPGWQARVDGAPVEIWRADAGLRALPLTAGQHTVTMDYRPLSFRIGVVLTLISLLLVLSGMIAGHRLSKEHASL